jgi:hypothetical protein
MFPETKRVFSSRERVTPFGSPSVSSTTETAPVGETRYTRLADCGLVAGAW